MVITKIDSFEKQWLGGRYMPVGAEYLLLILNSWRYLFLAIEIENWDEKHNLECESLRVKVLSAINIFHKLEMFNKYFATLFYPSTFPTWEYALYKDSSNILFDKLVCIRFLLLGIQKMTRVSMEHSHCAFQLPRSFNWLYAKIIFKIWSQRKYLGYQSHQVNNWIFLREGSRGSGPNCRR